MKLRERFVGDPDVAFGEKCKRASAAQATWNYALFTLPFYVVGGLLYFHFLIDQSWFGALTNAVVLAIAISIGSRFVAAWVARRYPPSR